MGACDSFSIQKLSLQRQMMENLIIAKARQDAVSLCCQPVPCFNCVTHLIYLCVFADSELIQYRRNGIDYLLYDEHFLLFLHGPLANIRLVGNKYSRWGKVSNI